MVHSILLRRAAGYGRTILAHGTVNFTRGIIWNLHRFKVMRWGSLSQWANDIADYPTHAE